MKIRTITNRNQKWRIHNTKEYLILLMEIQIKSKKHVKKCSHPKKFKKIKHSLCQSFLELILFLILSVTHCLMSNLSRSPSQYSWWFHTFFNDISAPYCRSFSTHTAYPKRAARCKAVCQNNVRKKQIFQQNISYILWSEIFPTLVGWEIDTLSPFSSFPPHPSRHSIISAPINHNSLNYSNSTVKMITKHTPWNEGNEKNLWESSLKG